MNVLPLHIAVQLLVMDVLPGSSIVISLGEHPIWPDDKPFISPTDKHPVKRNNGNINRYFIMFISFVFLHNSWIIRVFTR
jgi:hypothetical protein